MQKSGDYLAIPITINVVLIISDTLLIWASASKNKLLLWPWIILHLLEFLFFISMLILLMVIVPEPWFKAVVFLVGSPVIVLLVSTIQLLYHCSNLVQKHWENMPHPSFKGPPKVLQGSNRGPLGLPPQRTPQGPFGQD